MLQCIIIYFGETLLAIMCVDMKSIAWQGAHNIFHFILRIPSKLSTLESRYEQYCDFQYLQSRSKSRSLVFSFLYYLATMIRNLPKPEMVYTVSRLPPFCGEHGLVYWVLFMIDQKFMQKWVPKPLCELVPWIQSLRPR